jgi:hypothetical protein
MLQTVHVRVHPWGSHRPTSALGSVAWRPALEWALARCGGPRINPSYSSSSVAVPSTQHHHHHQVFISVKDQALEVTTQGLDPNRESMETFLHFT